MLLWTISVQGLESITEKNNKNKIKRIAEFKKKKVIYCSSDKIEMYMAFAMCYQQYKLLQEALVCFTNIQADVSVFSGFRLSYCTCIFTESVMYYCSEIFPCYLLSVWKLFSITKILSCCA